MGKKDDVLDVPGAEASEAIAALGAKIRLELHALVERQFEAFRSELRHDTMLALQSYALKLETKPDVGAALLAAYEPKLPRILHKQESIKGEVVWVEKRVATIADCENALAAGWKLRPE